MIQMTKASPQEAATVAALASRMWEDNTLEGLTEEFEEMLSSQEAAVYLLYADNQPVAFAQCQLRHDYVEGTESTPVGYLEGIFVEAPFRRRGLAGKLLAAAEEGDENAWTLQYAFDAVGDIVVYARATLDGVHYYKPVSAVITTHLSSGQQPYADPIVSGCSGVLEAVGDTVRFKVDYSAALRAFTSGYVEKVCE